LLYRSTSSSGSMHLGSRTQAIATTVLLYARLYRRYSFFASLAGPTKGSVLGFGDACCWDFVGAFEVGGLLSDADTEL
jgi:hypothetical protein